MNDRAVAAALILQIMLYLTLQIQTLSHRKRRLNENVLKLEKKECNVTHTSKNIFLKIQQQIDG